VNPFESAARAAKAAKLIDALDYAFELAKVTLPEVRYEATAGMSDAAWACAASCAGVNIPSLETREIVLDCYRRRVRASLDAQVAASLAAALREVANG